MRYKKDDTGRFDKRPHFELGYLDELCERTLLDYLTSTLESIAWPVSTETIIKLVERDTEELDLFTSMEEFGLDDGVDGFTDYSGSSKPLVYINKRLYNKPYLENRLRTTLAHEYGHVLLHGPLFRDDSPCKLLKSPDEWTRPVPRTLSQRAKSKDWMEWQANYAMGALLMPKAAVEELVTWYARKYGFSAPFGERTGHAMQLAEATSKHFLVSVEAASIRLKQMFLIMNP